MRHSIIRAEATVPPPALAVCPAEILVAVPALDEERHIAACLRSLMAGSPSMPAVEVVVADGGSRDATREMVAGLMAEFPNLALVDNPGRLQSAALNRVVETCARPEHRVLVRCDAHSVYPPGYVLASPTALSAGTRRRSWCRWTRSGAGGFQRAAAWIVDTPLGSGGAAHRGGRRSGWVDHGHHAGIRLDWFRRVGGYDPSFSHNEDAEFDHRLPAPAGASGSTRGFASPTGCAGTAAPRRQAWRYGRGRARTLRRTAPGRGCDRSCRPPPARAGAGLRSRRYSLGLLPPAAYAALLAARARTRYAPLSLRPLGRPGARGDAPALGGDSSPSRSLRWHAGSGGASPERTAAPAARASALRPAKSATRAAGGR